MKKLICAAIVAGSMFAMAEEPAKPAAAAPAAATAVKAVPKRPRLTDEQRAKMREQREKFMAERKARMLEIVKKYVSDEAKAKELVDELQNMHGRRNMMRPPINGAKPAGKPAAKPAEKK